MHDAIGGATANRIDDFLIKQMRVRVVSGRRIRLQSMTKIAAGNEGYAATQLLNRRAHATAKAHVIFKGAETVAQGDDATGPTVTLQKIERNCGPMIEIEIFDSHHDQLLVGRGANDFVKEFV